MFAQLATKKNMEVFFLKFSNSVQTSLQRRPFVWIRREHGFNQLCKFLWEALAVDRVLAISILQRWKVILRIATLVYCSGLEWNGVTCKLISNYPSCPDRLHGVVQIASWTWFRIEDLWGQMCSIATNIQT